MDDLKRLFITKEEALSVLDDDLHVFLNTSVGVILGAGWSKEQIEEAIEKAVRIEIAGEQAKAMKHGIAVTVKKDEDDTYYAFISTNMEKLEKLEKEMKERHGDSTEDGRD